MVTETRRDRGQLILVAAIVIAFIILGIVVVFNSVLYTQAISSGSSIESAEDVKTTELEITRGVRGTIQEANRAVDATEDENDYKISDTLERFGQGYRNATAVSRPVAVSLSNEEIDVDATVRNDDLQINDTVYTEGNGTVGHFTISVDDIEDSNVSASNGSGDTVEISSSDDSEYAIEGIDGDSCTVDTDGHTLSIDFIRNTINGETLECDVTLVTEQEPAQLQIQDNGNVDGEYTLVSKLYDEDRGGYGAWTVTLVVTYDSADASSERELEIDVYGDVT